MQIIIAPAKKMVVAQDTFAVQGQPQYLQEAATLLAAMQRLSLKEAQALWRCSDQLAQAAYRRLLATTLAGPQTPALLAFSGLAYQAMAPDLFTEPALAFAQANLRILSGFYGVLRPFDGVVPYRLSLDERLAVGDHRDLYAFWGARLYAALDFGHGPVLDLASKEYSRAVVPYLKPGEALVAVVFAQLVDGRPKVKATLAKQARGAMVRYLAEHQVTTLAGVTGFDDPRYRFDPECSSDRELVFIQR
ncbi:peroxide stress protein YaaA [Lacticaseibacillus suihuaensis]